MERHQRSLADVNHLIQLGKLLNSTIEIVIDEWSRESISNKALSSAKYSANGDTTASPRTADDPKVLPSRPLHQAQRTILAITGALTELIAEPCNRLQELATQYYESRALGIAAERRIPDMLAAAGDEGMQVEELSEKTGIQYQKLSRLLRALCSNHVFRQTAHDRFANNRISSALVKNEEFRAYILLFHLDIYTVSDHLPKYLLGPKGHSFKVNETAFQQAIGVSKPRWEWMAERISPEEISHDGIGYPGVPDPKDWSHLVPDNDGKVARPELDIFSLGMVGGGKVSAAAHPFDYPWENLPAGATVVDVGGGVGGFIVQLLSVYPELKCIVQDRTEVIGQAKESFWPTNAPALLQSGKVDLQVHDFFEPNPVKGADIYWLRGILHDWSDDYCVRILSALRESMSSHSRILICDQVMNTTIGSAELDSAPYPLPANYGYYTRYCHLRDISLMTSINGIERTPLEFRHIVERAGLVLEKIWETRSLQWIVEVRK